MARAAGRVDLDFGGDIGGAFAGKPELDQNIGDVFFKGHGGRVFLADQAIEFLFAYRSAAAQRRVPDIERLQLAAQPLADQGGHLFYLGRRQQFAEHRLHVFFRNFPVDVKTAADMGGILGAVGIDQAHGLECFQKSLVADIVFTGGVDFLAVGEHLVAERIPLVFAGVDHHGGDLLADDPFHDLVDQLLFEQALLVGVAGFELVADSPVADQLHVGREIGLHFGVHQAAHVDIVFRDVAVGVGHQGADFLVHGGRDARVVAAAHAGIGPLARGSTAGPGSFFLPGCRPGN